MTTGNPMGNSQAGLAIAGILGRIGCLTALIVFLALGAGMWLDARLGSRPLFTIGMILASVPATIVIVFRTVLAAAQRLTPPGSGTTAAASGDQTDGSPEDRPVAMGD